MSDFRPDFLIIPYQIAFDKKLQPFDATLYGVIYWMERLRNGKCTASNQLLADIMQSSPQTVQNSLMTLEKSGFIKRVFRDEARKQRLEIITKVSFRVSPVDDTLSPADDTKVSPVGDQISNTTDSKSKEITPAQEMKEFVEAAKTKGPRYVELVNFLADKGLGRSFAEIEIEKFCLYWTERNKSGTQQRWQLERTFEFRRRLATWMTNAQKFDRRGANLPSVGRPSPVFEPKDDGKPRDQAKIDKNLADLRDQRNKVLKNVTL